MQNMGSQRAFARYRGVSHRTVQVWVAQGKIRTLPDGRIDFQQADADLSRNGGKPRRLAGGGIRPRAVARDAVASGKPRRNAGSPSTLAEAQRELVIAKARLARLEFRKKSGQLLDARAVERGARECGRRIRDRLLSAAPRLTPMLLAIQEPRAFERALAKELGLICDELGPRAE